MFCNPAFNNYPILPLRQMPTGMQPGGTQMGMPSQYPAPQFPISMDSQMPMQQMPMQQMPMQQQGNIGTSVVPALMPPVTLGGFEQGPPTLTDIGYIPAFLKTQVGKRMRIQFLVGTDSFLDKSGTLVGVGIAYILLKDDDTGDIIMCDMYSIKFVNIFQ